VNVLMPDPTTGGTVELNLYNGAQVTLCEYAQK